MTTHGPAAVVLVLAALDAAGVGPGLPRATVAGITGTALDVVAGTMSREAAIDTVVYRWDLARPFTAKALDLAVEALTTTQE